MRLLILLLAGSLVHATTVESFLRNREGVRKLKDKAYLGAYQAFLKALEEEPLSPEVQMNLALTFETNEEFDKAEAAYKGALNLVPANSPHRFEILFNLAGVYGKEKKIDEALAAYQECLEIMPDSKEVKTNIELLWQGGGGGGEGDDKDKKDDKDGKEKKKGKGGEGDNDRKNSPQPQGDKDQKKQPRPFQSQELSPQDVKKILDEIKNQEQSVRAQEYERNAKEQGNSKDW